MVVFPVPGRPGHENDAVFFLYHLAENRRQSKAFESGDLRLQFAHDDGLAAVLLEDVHAETRHFPKRVTAVAGAELCQILTQPLIAMHQVRRDLLDLRQRQDSCIDGKLFKHAVLFHERRPADAKEQIGDILAALNHGSQKWIDDFFIHEKIGSLE